MFPSYKIKAVVARVAHGTDDLEQNPVGRKRSCPPWVSVLRLYFLKMPQPVLSVVGMLVLVHPSKTQNPPTRNQPLLQDAHLSAQLFFSRPVHSPPHPAISSCSPFTGIRPALGSEGAPCTLLLSLHPHTCFPQYISCTSNPVLISELTHRLLGKIR